MTTRAATAAVLCTVLAGCGGGGGSAPRNAADAKTFTYGDPRGVLGEESVALEAQLASALAAQASPDLSQASGVTDFSALTAVLLGEYGGTAPMALLRAGSPRPALALGLVGDVTMGDGFDDPGCVVASPTRVQMNACKATFTSGTGTEVITIGGFVDASSALTWSLTVGIEVTDTAAALSGTASYRNTGSLTVTDTTVVGQALASIAVDFTVEGQRAAFQVDESLDLDVTYQTDPQCITGGTLEAKRVWKLRPAGVQAAQLPDVGALVTWTGCGSSTVAIGVN